MNRALMSGFVLAVAISAASADSYTFTYFDGFESGNGTLEATAGVATSGVLNLTGGSYTGSFNLIPLSDLVATTPAEVYITQPLNLWTVDNLIYPGQDPSLDQYGLIFGTSPTTSTSGLWINLYNVNITVPGGAPTPPVDPYTLGINDGNGVVYQNAGGTFTLNGVPEPAPFVCVGLGALGLLVRRKRSAAR